MPVVANSEEGNSVILNVSKAKVDNDRVYYNVSYVTPVRNNEGRLCLKNTIAEVSYDKSEDLVKNPTGVFLLSKDKANIKVLKSDIKTLDVFQPVEFNKVSQNRRKL